MLDFDTYVMRHGEFGAQALVEQVERVSGNHLNIEAPLPLDVRWNAVMNDQYPQMAA